MKLQNCLDKNGSIELEVKSTFVENVESGSGAPAEGGQDSDDGAENTESSSSTISSSSKKPLPGRGLQQAKTTAIKDEPPKSGIAKTLPMSKAQPQKTNELHQPVISPDHNSGLKEDLPEHKTEPFFSPPLKQDPIQAEPLEDNKVKDENRVSTFQLSELQFKLQRLEEERNSIIRDKQQSEQSLQEQIKQYIGEKEESFAKIKDLEIRIDTLEREKANLLDTNNELMNSKNQEHTTASELESELNSNQAKIAQLLKQKTDLNSQVIQLSAELGKTSAKCDQLGRDSSDQLSKIKSLESTCSKLSTEKDNLAKNIETLRAKLQEAQGNLEQHSLQQSSSLSDFKKQTETIISDLKKQLAEKTEIIHKKEQQENELSIQLQNAKQKVLYCFLNKLID